MKYTQRASDRQPWYLKYGILIIAFSVQFIGAIAWATNLHSNVERAKDDIRHISGKIEAGSVVISEMPYLKERISRIEKKQDQMLVEQQTIAVTLSRIEAKLQ